MRIETALNLLRGYNYRLEARDGTVMVYLPPQEQPEAESLLAVLRADKPAVLEALNNRFEPLSAEDGDRR